MATPTNHKTLKTPLSTIKKGPQKGLRNILVHPQEFIWPIVKDENGEDLKSILDELLPNKINPSRDISWAQLRKMSKEERTSLKTEIQSKIKKDKKDNAIINGICLGINAVTRALEKNSLASVLVDSNVEPLIMIKHIVSICQNNDIPVILVSFLKSCTLHRFGFASAALGLKKPWIQDETLHFQPLHEKLLNLADAFPKTHNPVQLFANATNEEEITDLQRAEPFLLSTSIYLNRKSIKERVFIPPHSQKLSKSTEEASSEFIRLEDDIDMAGPDETPLNISRIKRYIDIHRHEVKTQKKNANNHKNHDSEDDDTKKMTIYRPLKVKRVQGSAKRLKATKTTKLKNKSSAVKK